MKTLHRIKRYIKNYFQRSEVIAVGYNPAGKKTASIR
jgi:hypothetical protein